MTRRATSKKTRKPNSRSGATRKSETGHAIPWAWLIIGILIGLFVTFLINLPKSSDTGETSTQTETKQDTREVRKSSQQDIPPPPKEKFEFYTILPDMEVTVPENFNPDSEPQKNSKQVPVEQATANNSTSNTKASVDSSLYQLQVGSFKDLSKADTLKAKLALLGIETNIQAVNLKNGETWYRVRIGPTRDAQKISQIREQLKAHDINSFMQKVKS